MSFTQVFKLFKLQIDEIYNIFKVRDYQKMIRGIIKYLIVVVGLYFLLDRMLKRIAVFGIDINNEVVSIVLLILNILLVLFFTGNIVNNLFLSKNNEILLSLPASANQIFISKILVIYFQELVVTSIIVMPMLLALAKYASYGTYFYAIFIFIILFFPILPLAIGSFLAIPCYKIYLFLREKVYLSAALILSSVVILLLIYMNALGDLSNFNLGTDQVLTVVRINNKIIAFGAKNNLFVLLAKSFSDKAYFMTLLIYFSICIILIGFALVLIKSFFFKIAMQIHENNQTIAKNKRYKIDKPLYSLIKKEALMTFRSPGHIFQYFIFAFLMPLIVILYDKLLLSMDVITEVGKMMLNGSHLLIITMLAMLSNIISASAISREGHSFYVMKIIPVDYYRQTLAKVLFNAIISIGSLIVTAISISIASNFLPHTIGFKAILFSSFIAIFLSVGHICLSYDYDLRNPLLNWFDAGSILKLNNNTALSMIWALVLSVGFCILFIMLTAVISSGFSWFILITMSLAFALFYLYRLILRVSYRYEELEV